MSTGAVTPGNSSLSTENSKPSGSAGCNSATLSTVVNGCAACATSIWAACCESVILTRCQSPASSQVGICIIWNTNGGVNVPKFKSCVTCAIYCEGPNTLVRETPIEVTGRAVSPSVEVYG